MTALLAPPRANVQQAGLAPYRLTVGQYLHIVEAGILTERDRCYLWEGALVAKMSRNPPHDGSLHILMKRLMRVVPDGWEVRDQKSLVLDQSVPEPDVVIVRGDERTFTSRHPFAADTSLVIEVAESSLDLDREAAEVFARNGVPIYWIVNLVDGMVEVYTQPSGPTALPAYAERRDYVRGESVPLTIDGNLLANLPVSDLLP